MSDKINPDYYKRGNIESIEVLENKLSPEQYIGALRGNQYKYWDRRGHKDTENLDEVGYFEKCIEECDKQNWYCSKEKEYYVKERLKAIEKRERLKSSTHTNEWIDDPLVDED